MKRGSYMTTLAISGWLTPFGGALYSAGYWNHHGIWNRERKRKNNKDIIGELLVWQESVRTVLIIFW